MEGEPYREPAPVPPDPYLVAWARLRRRRHALLASTCGTVVAAGLLSSMLPLPRNEHFTGALFGLFMSVPLGLFILARLPPFLCPACEHPFFQLVGGELGHTRKCDHCEIEIGSALNPHLSRLGALPRPFGARQVLVALGWLVTAVLVWVGAFAATLTSPGIGLAAVAAGGVGALAVLVARAMRGRTLSRLLVLPMVALIAGALCGARAWRANEQERQALEQQAEEIMRQLQELHPKSAGCPQRVPSNP